MLRQDVNNCYHQDFDSNVPNLCMYKSKEYGLTPIGTMSTLSQLCSALPTTAPAINPAAVMPPARTASKPNSNNKISISLTDVDRAPSLQNIVTAGQQLFT